MVSAFPLAQVALTAIEVEGAKGATSSRDDGRMDVPTIEDLPFIPSTGSSLDPRPDGVSSTGKDGASSRPSADELASPARADASSSVLLSQVLGAAELMGYDVAVPELPVDALAPEQPLRAAILAWIAATGSVVPPDELARELARADALPLAVQRDVALLLLSTIEATQLQRAALAGIAPEDLAWIAEHPEVADDLARGVETPETRAVALLAGKVDIAKSIEATLLLLQAVEATRGSFESREAAAALGSLGTSDLDATTKATLTLLLTAQDAKSDADKVRLAAKLVAVGAGIELPAPKPAVPFADALGQLTAASGQVARADDIIAAVTRADALPDDLEAAVSRLLVAEADAIRAANPAHLTDTSQQEALAGVLLATADALPVLEKYALFWSDAPTALRMGEWEPNARIAWAAHHAGLFASTQGGLLEVARSAASLHGAPIDIVPSIPERTFSGAYAAMLVQAGITPDAELLDGIAQAGASLDAATRDAATVMMAGSAESARLYELAYAGLSADERAFLASVQGIDELYAKTELTSDELATLSRAASLSSRVDAEALWQSAAVATLATREAKDILEGAGSYHALDAGATPVETGFLAFLKRLLPFGSARAQEEATCDPLPGLIELNCEEDVILRIYWPVQPAEDNAQGNMDPSGGQGIVLFDPTTGGQFGVGVPLTFSSMRPFRDTSEGTGYAACDQTECVVYSYGYRNGEQPPNDGRRHDPTDTESVKDLLVLTGSGNARLAPQTAMRLTCPSYPVEGLPGLYTASPDGMGSPTPYTTCKYNTVVRYGAPTITLDLGGDDTYVGAVGMVHPNASLPVSLHLDMGGSDGYSDPTGLYDDRSPILRRLGQANGHPTQGSAPIGGVAIAVDAGGQSDNFFAPSFSQGYARQGFALLADLGGTDDNYFAQRFSQGAASDSFTLGAGILLDLGGADSYVATTGHGYGLGGVLVDLGGKDSYRNDHAANGAPLVKLDIIPGGDVTTLVERDNNRVWLDGPGTLSAGIGIDTEAIPTATPSDNDGIPDFVEFLVGTDPRNTSDSPVTNPAARGDAVATDSDFDLYPDYVERALSTDPEDGKEYPAGFPSIGIAIPQPIWDELDAIGLDTLLGQESNELQVFDQDTGTGDAMRGHDKIVDLRLPVQDAGSIEYACTGAFYYNNTVPLSLFPGPLINGVAGSRDPATGGPATDESGKPIERCVYLAYSPTGPGEGSAALPGTSVADPDARTLFTYELPAGILAIGDVVRTNYTEDYFLVIDLGGSDEFNGSAGGALPVLTTPVEEEGQSASASGKTSFWAPSLVVNLDLHNASNGVVAGVRGDDRYVNASRDYAQGALFGVLVDNAGNDVYVARDGSQGALGGVLLDLDGTDRYTARDLAQGAGLAGPPAGAGTEGADRPDLPEGGNATADQAGAMGSRAHRRVLAGMLLDLGKHPRVDEGSLHYNQTFVAHAHSQGFARGFAQQNPNAETAQVYAQGILLSVGGRDIYDHARDLSPSHNLQGVGGIYGAGILVDREGVDDYLAADRFSQGATISQLVGTGDKTANGQPVPATGILIDITESGSAQARDRYVNGAGNETLARHQSSSITRSETPAGASGRLYADLALRIDTAFDGSNPATAQASAEALLAGVGGTGSDQIDGGNFTVNLPTARLAIGSEAPTTWTRDYAFAVDLGGANRFQNNAAGTLRDIIAQGNPQSAIAGTGHGASQFAAPLSMYPVSFLLDAGNASSTYVADRGLAQGAGFFSVGVLADLGGRDTYTALPSLLPQLKSDWLGGEDEIVPAIDGTIGGDWQTVPEVGISLVSRDARISADWKVHLANDNRSLYLALEGPTMSRDDDHYGDRLVVDMDIGRRQLAWDHPNQRTGVDRVVFEFSKDDGCVATDWGLASPGTPTSGLATFVQDTPLDTVDPIAFEGECRFTEDGRVYFELRKDLVRTESPFSNLDLDYCWDDDAGFGHTTFLGMTADGPRYGCDRPSVELGLLVEFQDAGAGLSGSTGGSGAVPASFFYPADARIVDGAEGARLDGNFSDEMARWAAVGLANGKDGVLPGATRAPSLAQGASLAGVGILAMLGNGHAESVLTASDRAQGFGSFGGLGMIVDAGGSDRYVGRDRVQAAAEVSGAGLLLDLDGNDNYLAKEKAYGWVPAASTTRSAATFIDLSGDDEYAFAFATSRKVENLRQGIQQAGNSLPPDGNNLVWAQNETGVGIDYRLQQTVRDLAGNIVADALYGTTRTTMMVTVYDPDAPDVIPGTGCTRREDPYLYTARGGEFNDYRATGTVCFLATVDTGDGTFEVAAGQFATLRSLAGNDPAAKAEVARAERTARSVNVSAVEFSIDRERVATQFFPVNNVTPRVTEWAAVVDLTKVPDGVKRVKATPVFEATWDNRSVLVFSDGADNPVDSTAQVRTLVVDGVPEIGLELEPVYEGRASSTFSPFAYGAAQQLYINWTASHDATEERLEAANGWELQRHNMSFPCAVSTVIPNEDQPPLCGQLAFFLPSDDTTLSTAFNPTLDNLPDNLEVETIGGTARYGRSTDPLNDDLYLWPDGTFHLALPNRTAILPVILTTEIKITVKNGSDVINGPDGEPWVLGGGKFRGGSGGVTSVGQLAQLFSIARPQVTSAAKQARDAAESARGNPVSGIINTTEAGACEETVTQSACDALRGEVNSGQFKPCVADPEPNGGSGGNLFAWAAWYGVQTVERGGVFTPKRGPTGSNNIPNVPLVGDQGGVVCRNYFDTLHEQADPAGEPLAEVGGQVLGANEVSTVLAVLDPPGSDALNFTDFWFDVIPRSNEELPANATREGIRFENGVLVVPRDLSISLDFDVVPDSTSDASIFGTPGATVNEALSEQADDIDEADVLPGREDIPVPLLNRTNIEGDVVSALKDPGAWQNVDSLLNQFGSLPGSFFYAQSGGHPDHQARLELRVPAERTSAVSITLRNPTSGDERVLLEGAKVPGDLEGTPTRWGAAATTAVVGGETCAVTGGNALFLNTCYWAAMNDGTPAGDGIADASPLHRARINWTHSDPSVDRWTQHNQTFDSPEESFEGVMVVNVTVIDDAQHVSHREDTVLIDLTSPQTSVTTAAFLGKGMLPASGVPIRWLALDVGGRAESPTAGSGIKNVYVYYRAGLNETDEGGIDDIDTWEGPFNFSAGARSLVVPRSDSSTYLMMTLGEDFAGNVEGSANQPTLELALAEGFATKIAAGANQPNGYRHVEIDQVAPRFGEYGIAGGTLTPFEGNEITFVRPGQPIGFSVCARDGESGIAPEDGVTLKLDHVDPKTQEVYPHTYPARPAGNCEGDGVLYRADAWGLDNADAARFPEGLWAVAFEVRDRGLNKVTVPVGNVILDHRAPAVVVEPPVLPAGQTAVRTNDTVKIRFSADDTFGVDLAHSTVDASAFSKNASAKNLTIRPVRVNGVIYQEVTFLVDRENLQNAAYDVVLVVRDLAGHSTTVRVPVLVNARAFEFVPGSLSVTDVTHNGFVLRWTTTENTTSMAELGTTSIALNARTPIDMNATTQHALKVENLLPSTTYYVRAVSASTGGLKKASDVIEVKTTTALFLQPVLPTAGSKVSGLVKVAFKGGLLDSADFVTYTLEVRDGPAKPWTFVTTATRQGDAHELTWNSTRFLDGTTYELRLSAQAGRDVAAAVIGPFTSDNTPASVLVITPLLATNDTTPQLIAEASDALSGLAASPAALRIDGVAVEGNLSITPLPDGRVRIGYDVPAPLAAGMRTFELRVEDSAGNVAKETWKVAIDGDAPVIAFNPTRFSPGTAAAKTGGTVTLNVTVADLSGVSLVTADTSALSSVEPDARLVKIVGSGEWQATFGVTAAEAGAVKKVTVRATDLAGNSAEATLDVPLDNLAPELEPTIVSGITHTAASVKVPSREPILITGVATAPASPAVTLSTTELEQSATLRFEGLLPSRTYAYKLQVTDAAGNEVPLAGTFATLQDVKAPSTVGPLSVLDLLNGTLRLGWTAADDDVGVNVYRVYRSEDAVTFRVLAEVKGTSYDDAGLPYERAYVYKVAAVDHGANEGPTDGTLRAAATAVPSLSVGLASPTIGTVSTTFRYTITYVSPGGVPAAYVRVILDGVPQNMTYQSGDATTGAVYTYETRLAPHKRDEPHTYTFEASDGRYTAVFPDDGTVMRGPLVSGDALGASELAGFASFAQKVPLGGVAGLALAMVAAVGLAAVLRKKKEGSK